MYRAVSLTIAAALWITGQASAAATSSDYLSDELRASVETLKIAASNRPTDRTNVETRLETLWDWINAYALSGGYVPVNATHWGPSSQISGHSRQDLSSPSNKRLQSAPKPSRRVVDF